MISLVQAATMPHDPVDWRSIAIVAIGAYNALRAMVDSQRETQRARDRERADAEIAGLRKKQDEHAVIIAELAAQIGIKSGGGMSAQMTDLVDEVKGLREDVHNALITIARNSARTQGT